MLHFSTHSVLLPLLSMIRVECAAFAVHAQGRDLDRAQQCWDRAVRLSEADGDSASAERHRGNLRMLDDVRKKLRRDGTD